MSTEDRKCQNCEYFQPIKNSDLVWGVCLAKSPQVLAGFSVPGPDVPRAVWPTSNKDDWCGEFAQKEQAVEMKA